MRNFNRKNDHIRKITITRDYMKYAEGSVLIEMGDTKIICTASIENKVPPFLRGQNKGWITAEYNMLPRSTQNRKQRDITKLKVDGRSMEIQRLIGRFTPWARGLAFWPGALAAACWWHGAWPTCGAARRGC